ncbi:ABC transporter permease [Streptomyces chiangmaiensis]|uniref:ABC transporter permease subunit n=1 Tax=Streptomyces chiangmaiensis TaxID=766497 RepID=A0ABU7FR10_9ACTN|nr:ABC transporter permease subunit [Streptomyces chiangmaiensis]MED7826556.1 ABC transporter permease subunit [Streptomyces chiangmaiensis]
MSFWEYVDDRHHQLLVDACRHAGTVFPCTVVAAVLGVGIALAARGSERAGTLATAATGVFLTVPALALLGLLIPLMGPGPAPAATLLTLCGLLPIVRNSVLGLRAVDPSRVRAARVVGMARPARLVRVELPVAWPSILAGIRTSTRLLMGVAAITAYASGPGLGNEIRRGLGSPDGENALNQVLAGTLGIVALSLLFDAGYLLLGRLTIPGRPTAPAQPEEKRT